MSLHRKVSASRSGRNNGPGQTVIGAGYSGNLDFMNENNSLLVNYHLIPLADDYLDWRGQHWAAADGDHAAAHMRRFYDDRAFAAALGARGDTLLREWSPHAAGRRIRARLDAINASLAGRSHMSARARRFSALRGAHRVTQSSDAVLQIPRPRQRLSGHRPS